MISPKLEPRRSDATRQALVSAFTALVFAKGFENVTVRELVLASDVARSTFYEHFSGKEDILRASMAHLFTVIAECVDSEAQPENLIRVLDHLWQNRRLTDAIFSGAARLVLARALGEMVEARLRAINTCDPPRLAYRLAAIHLAEGQLALVESWMRGRAHCSVEDLADALHRSSRASAIALLFRPIEHLAHCATDKTVPH